MVTEPEYVGAIPPQVYLTPAEIADLRAWVNPTPPKEDPPITGYSVYCPTVWEHILAET
jgi:hypothetical protein